MAMLARGGARRSGEAALPNVMRTRLPVSEAAQLQEARRTRREQESAQLLPGGGCGDEEAAAVLRGAIAAMLTASAVPAAMKWGTFSGRCDGGLRLPARCGALPWGEAARLLDARRTRSAGAGRSRVRGVGWRSVGQSSAGE